MPTIKATAQLGDLNFVTALSARVHHYVGDEPHEDGGLDAGPSPYELVLWGLAECTAATLRIYAQRKEWQLGAITVDVTLETGSPAQFDISISTENPTTDEQKQKLILIAHKCPVHKLLIGEKTMLATIK